MLILAIVNVFLFLVAALDLIFTDEDYAAGGVGIVLSASLLYPVFTLSRKRRLRKMAYDIALELTNANSYEVSFQDLEARGIQSKNLAKDIRLMFAKNILVNCRMDSLGQKIIIPELEQKLVNITCPQCGAENTLLHGVGHCAYCGSHLTQADAR